MVEKEQVLAPVPSGFKSTLLQNLLCDLGCVDLKWIDCQIVFSKDGFIQGQQRTAVRGLQPWWATCKSLNSKERRCFYRGDREVRSELGTWTFHWLSPCQARREVVLPVGGKCVLFIFWQGGPCSLSTPATPKHTQGPENSLRNPGAERHWVTAQCATSSGHSSLLHAPGGFPHQCHTGQKSPFSSISFGKFWSFLQGGVQGHFFWGLSRLLWYDWPLGLSLRSQTGHGAWPFDEYLSSSSHPS